MFKNISFALFFIFASQTLSAESVSSSTPLLLFPELGSQKVGEANPGDQVRVVQASGTWTLIEISKGPKSIKGWILSSNLSSEPSTTNTGTTAPTSLKPALSPEKIYSKTLSSDPSAAFAFPTAMQQPKGTTSAKGLYFLSWNFEHVVLDQLSAGLTVLTPIGLMGFIPNVKISTSLTSKVHVALSGSAGYIASLFSTRGNNSAFFYTSGVLATVGDTESAFTFGNYIAGGRADAYGHVLLLNANAFHRFTPSVKGIIDAIVPIATHRKADFANWSAVAYGARFGGSELYGDVGFLAPIYANAGRFYRYFPLGVPFVSLSVLL